MAFAKQVNYLCIFEFEGAKHVVRLAGSSDIDRVRGHWQQVNAGIKILELRAVKDLDEIQAAADQLRDGDPLHVPITNQDLAAKTSGPNAPAPH